MKVWPLIRPRRATQPALPTDDFGSWIAAGEEECTSEHGLPKEAGGRAQKSAVNGLQTADGKMQNAVFGQQTADRERAKRAKKGRCSSSSPARDIHSKAHGPSSISAARESGSRAEIVAGLGFASAAPAEEVIATADVSPASAAESTFDLLWRQQVHEVYGHRRDSLAGACAQELAAYQGEVPAPWPLVGSPAATAREILEGALARGARQKRVRSRDVDDFAKGLVQLRRDGLLETTGDLGDGCLTWHGRSLPPLATGRRRG